MTFALRTENLHVKYGNKTVLENVAFSAQTGRITAIIGPNGAGKSTLIKAVMGLIPVESGHVFLDEKPMTPQMRSRVAYVPQRNAVDWDFPASALDVVCMGLYRTIGWFRPVGKAHKTKALSYLEQVGLEDFAHRPIGQLSGGQQQRVFLARALAQDSHLYLMDEPFAGVDAATENSILHILKIMKENGRTVICVHHDLQTVADYFDDAVALNGKIIASGPVQDIMQPAILQETYGGKLLVLS